MGCYRDQWSRTLGGKKTTSSSMTFEKCKSICSHKEINAKFFGLEVNVKTHIHKVIFNLDKIFKHKKFDKEILCLWNLHKPFHKFQDLIEIIENEHVHIFCIKWILSDRIEMNVSVETRWQGKRKRPRRNVRTRAEGIPDKAVEARGDWQSTQTLPTNIVRYPTQPPLSRMDC